MLAILIIGLMAGPAVSLEGSPTVSPVMAALCHNLSLLVKFILEKCFFINNNKL